MNNICLFFSLCLWWGVSGVRAHTSFDRTAASPFITTWRTTADNESITIPTTGPGYSYSVDWGDGSTDATIYTANATHEYATAGIYTVSVSGDFPRIFFLGASDRNKILTVEQWGDIAWTSMSRAFQGCSNLTVPAMDAPDLSDVTDLSYMFVSATSFNQPINHWDVSTITNMEGMFRGTSFNQPLDNWDVSNVTSMFNMFFGNVAFNQDISNWDVSKVTSMQWMFYNNTGGFSAFNQNLSGWDISSVTTMDGMLWNSGLSRQNYEATLAGWATLDEGETKIPTGVALSSDGHRYCDDTYRNLLTKSTGEGGYGWTITGDAQVCSLVLSVANQTVDEDTELSFTVSATYTGDGTLAYTLDETSESKGMTLNEETGAFSWTPTQAQAGNHSATITVHDDGSSKDSYTFTITVNAVNDAPVLSVITGPAISQGEEEIITNAMLLITDEDNTPEEIVFTVTSLPANGSLFKNETGLTLDGTFTQADVNENRISYRHDGFGSASDKFTFSVSDGSGGTIAPTDFQVTVDIVLSAEPRWSGGVRLYPIPARKEVTIKIVNTYLGTVSLRVVDLSGREVIVKNVMKDNPELIHTINISSVATEIAFIRVAMGGQFYTLKLLKQ